MTPKRSVCYGYTRVSTERQHAEGLSLEDQQIRIGEFYTRHLQKDGVVWGAIYQDGGVSGNMPFEERAAGKILYSRLQPGDHVIMTKLDRGFRNLRDFLAVTEKWLKRGIFIHMLDMGGGMSMDTSTPQGELMYTIFAAMAQMMRRIIRQNCQDGMDRRKDKYGRGTHRPKIGSKNIGSTKRPKFVPFLEERAQMALITHLIEDYKLSFPNVERLFSAYDFETTPGGATWTLQRVQRGYREYVIQGMVDPCCEFPPPQGWTPYKHKGKLRMKGQKKKGDKRQVYAPEPWCLLIRVTASTLPSRAQRLLSPKTTPSSPAPLPGQVVPRRRSGLALVSPITTRRSNGARQEPASIKESAAPSPQPECGAADQPSLITGSPTSSAPPESPTSSST
jgi:DNA invertase Pin-like site-specific DNA recombinase